MTIMGIPLVIPPVAVYAATTITILLAISDIFIGEKVLNVAFVGNSFQYFNDIPRFMEAISAHHVRQDSCLRSSATLRGIFKAGNGMEDIFNTSNSLLEDGDYDVGAPDVKTLFHGKKEPAWDFVVMNDRTYYPASNVTRNSTEYSLKHDYLPLLKEVGATPVFIATYAVKKAGSSKAKKLGINMTDVPTYTVQIKEGYKEYAKILKPGLPDSQTPRISPSGDAFMVVWKERRDIWNKLFNYDGHHPSPHGTYLQGCVLYCTLFGKAPSKQTALPSDPSILFENSRVMQRVYQDPLPTPTLEEAEYLYDVATRVTLGNLRGSTDYN